MSWSFSSWSQPAAAPDGESSTASTGQQQQQLQPPPLLDPEEVRRRRLANLEVATTAVGGNSNSVSTDPPMSPMKVAIEASSAQPPPQQQQPLRSPEKATAKTLTLLLESVLQLSIRSSCQAPVVFLAGAAGGSSAEGTFDSSRVSDMLCLHLADMGARGGRGGGASNSACFFLYGCFKRAQQRLFSCAEAQMPELTSCRNQIVSLLASCLMEPDIFEAASAESCRDLLRLLGDASSGGAGAGGAAGGPDCLGALLEAVAAELEAQGALSRVANTLFSMCFSDMSPASAAGGQGGLAAAMLMQGGYPFPVSAAAGFAPSATAVVALSAERRLAAELGAHPSFIVAPDLAVAAPQPAALQRAMMMPHAFFAAGGVSGTAFEHNTMLGRVLRAVSIDPNDPQIVAMFRDAHKQPRNAIEGRVNEFRGRQSIAQAQVTDIVLRLLKQKKCKDRAMQWLRQGVALNLEAGKERPSPFVASSKGFMLNLGSVMLRLCRPFMNDIEKIRKIDWHFLIDSDSQDIYPTHVTPLTTAIPKDVVSFDVSRREPSSNKEYNFLTSSFFLTLRALSLGVVQECIRYPNVLRGLSRYRDGLDTGSREAVHYLVNKLVSDINMTAPDLIKDLLSFTTTVCSWMLTNLPDASPPTDASKATLVDWMVNMDPSSTANIESYRFLSALLDSVVSDVCEILLFVAKIDVSHFCTVDLQPVLSVIVYFLRRPWIIASPHLRARLGQVLFYVFLPSSERDSSVEHYTGIKGRDGQHVCFLERDRECVAFLAPALLLLYGDVERTGFYDKLTNRRAIMVVLQFLWKQQSHRPAFRGIAGASSSAESDAHRVNFIKFANGLLNETNALVSSVMDKLQEIRATQLQMNSGQEWASLSAETRSQITDRHAENETEVRFKATLCVQTMNMLNYLTSDEVIRQPFLLDEILPRFTSMLLNVVGKLSGPKSLEIKVDNMESYNFEPKRMLYEVCSAMLHFADSEAFWRSMSQDGFFENGVPLSKAVGVLSKFNLLPPADIATFEQMVSRAKDARSSYQNLEALADSAPQEFLDPLLSTIMKDPVLLPTSSHIVDRATIYQHLLNDEKDPFNRMPLTVSMLVPQEELKNRIHKWLADSGVNI